MKFGPFAFGIILATSLSVAVPAEIYPQSSPLPPGNTTTKSALSVQDWVKVFSGSILGGTVATIVILKFIFGVPDIPTLLKNQKDKKSKEFENNFKECLDSLQKNKELNESLKNRLKVIFMKEKNEEEEVLFECFLKKCLDSLERNPGLNKSLKDRLEILFIIEEDKDGQKLFEYCLDQYYENFIKDPNCNIGLRHKTQDIFELCNFEQRRLIGGLEREIQKDITALSTLSTKVNNHQEKIKDIEDKITYYHN